ncbi:MAG TPA: hypothetical protein VM846_10610 [Vicinamibacterales bacterium]|nr:hypothetical protein [Vicinamibacterales bacterium]
MPHIRRSVMVNAGLALTAVLLLFVMERVTGRIQINEGRGWDGVDYSNMLNRWDHGTVDTSLRPLVVVANRPVYRLTRDPVTAFRLMNFLYIGVLCFAVCLLFDRYSSDVAAKVLLVLNLFVTIALAKYVAFYPVLIDAGALALVVLAIYFIVAGKRPLAAVAVAAAILAREFAIATIAFGVVRDLRRRVPVWVIAATYAPAIVVWFSWRTMVVQRWARDGREPLGYSALIDNLEYWKDPFFVALFVYFALTIFGGVSLLVLARFGTALRQCLREPEWAVYGGLVLVAAAMGDADLWRYLAYLLPAAVVLFAVCAGHAPPLTLRGAGKASMWRWIVTGALVCVATIATQRPFQAMDVKAYFLDWFPYYIQQGENVPLPTLPALWPVWGWRFLMTTGLLWLLAVSAPVSADDAVV